MGRFKTERAIVLQESELSLVEKICFAASDYRHAIRNENFANAHGGADLLRDDLFAFVDMWVETL